MANAKRIKNRRVDRKIFKKTAMRTDARNVPGRYVPKGGIDL